MEEHYKLKRIKELADNDNEFILALAQAFINEVPADAAILRQAVNNNAYSQAYQTAHKMKPTVDVFELGILDKLIEIQDWGKYEKKNEDVTSQLKDVLQAVENATKELKSDFDI